MEYHIVTGTSLHTLEETVRQFIADGWRPLGGPFLTTASGSYLVIGQALTRQPH